MNSTEQNKQKEIDFFNDFSNKDEYNVFTENSNQYLIQNLIQLGEFKQGNIIADIGCGSGIFTQLLKQRGLNAIGIDISLGLLKVGKTRDTTIEFLTGDAERLPLKDNSVDAVLLSGIIHHFPDYSQLAHEIHRILKPNGTFSAFDPNRLNPVMYLLRDRSSPLYCGEGVTENERPILPKEIKERFTDAGFSVHIKYLAGLKYRYVKAGLWSRLLPLYNLFENVVISLFFLRCCRAFIITYGKKI